MNKSTAAEIVGRLREIYGVDTDSALCQVAGINRQTLSGWKSRDSIDYSLCVSIAIEKGYSLDWLLTGAGPRWRGAIPEVDALSPEEEAILALFRSLDGGAKRDIQSAAEEKKRLMDIESRLKDLSTEVAQVKKPA